MGVSTDGILFFGYVWDEEVETESGFFSKANEEDWAYYLSAKRGVEEPFIDGDYPAWRKDQPERWQKVYKDHHATIAAIQDEFACDMGWHGSDSYNCPYIFVKGTETTARRGYPEVITSLEVPAGAAEALASFCEALGIDPPEGQVPAWYLVSYWG